MKKVLLSAALLGGMLFGANAQEEAAASASGDYKPEAGEKSLEVQFSPLGGSPISIGGIRFRSFSSSTSAMRANVYLGYSSKTEITQQENSDTDQKELKDKESSFTIAIAPGIESHFAGTSRISPYIGVELPLAWNTKTSSSDYQNADDVFTNKTTDGYFEIGLNALAGVDFYFTKKMYLGTELGFGLQYHKDSATKSKPGEGDAPDDVKNGSEFTLAPNVQGQIRLGFIF
jgi:opacity protein-like surface antigen